jgi:hypothetical protein
MFGSMNGKRLAARSSMSIARHPFRDAALVERTEQVVDDSWVLRFLLGGLRGSLKVSGKRSK